MMEFGRVAARIPSGTAIAIDPISPSRVSLGRGRQTGLDLVSDRLSGGERVAEVAACQIADVTDELHVERLVEAELYADLLDRLLGGGRPGEIGRGVAGQRPRQQGR